MGESWDCQQAFSSDPAKAKFMEKHMPDLPLDSHMAGGYDEYNRQRKFWESVWELTETMRR